VNVDFDLTDVQKAVRDTARNFARTRIAPVARDNDRACRFPKDLLAELAGLGLLGVNVSEGHGGAGAGTVAYVLAMMEIAQACASTSVAMAVTNMCGEVIERWGSEAQKAKYLPRLTSGALTVGSFALSEPHCGSDAAALRTTAERTATGYLLNGAKQWITSGDHAGVMIVWARLKDATGRPIDGAKGITALIVEGGTAGLIVGRHEEKMGLRASTTVALTFEDCKVPADALLGKEGEGFLVAMTALDGGRLGIGAQACGIARAALDASRKYARDRKAFGHPIGDLQAIRFKIANMATDLAAAELLVLRAAFLKESGKPFSSEGSKAKVFATEMAQRVCSEAVQIHGGYGYLDEFPVERYLRDARATTIYEGTSEIQRVIISRHLLRI
jgi:alkylation response protein AidB-like acyl-CoA dehydrogenase